MEKNNYLEHEIEVKYMDFCLESSKDWDWFLDALCQSYDFSDVKSWNEYQQANPLRKVYSYIIRIVSIDGVHLESKVPVLNDIICIAYYYKGFILFNECNASINTAFGRMLLLVVKLALLVNAENKTEYIFYGELLTRRNEFQLVNTTLIKDCADEILQLAYGIDIDGFDAARKCLEDNINEVLVPVDKDLLGKHRSSLLNVDCFNYQVISIPDYISWQESFLLEMLSVDVKDRKIVPLMDFGSFKRPDISRWTKENINKMIRYFSDEVASFVIETIAYILYGDEPSQTTILNHCSLYLQEVDNLENYKKTSVSTYCVLSYLFEDKIIYSIKTSELFQRLIAKIQSYQEPVLLSILSNDGLPISKQQKKILYDYYENLYKSIDGINDPNSFLDYLMNPDIVKRITTDYLFKVTKKFNDFTEDMYDLQTANIFYEYMHFLIEANSRGVNLNKNVVRGSIIAVQKLWQEEYYEPTCNCMQVFEYKHTISTKDIERYNEIVLKTPLLFAKSSSSLGEKELLNIMETASSNPLQYSLKSMEISHMYPIPHEASKFNKTAIDALISQSIHQLIKTRGYKLLNILSSEKYLMAMYNRVHISANSVAGLIGCIEKELYDKVSRGTNYKLIDYSENLVMAHITQLFPLMEQLIRKIGSLTGYVPFQLNDERFMKYKDPSSILIAILTDIYNTSSSFESAPDILMTYNYMYNGNSLNIRNECIHGRNYQNGNSLRFAFRLTLLVLNTLMERVEIIEQNHSTN